jgi:AraC family ethanolamine operon transcriptional activator
MLLKRGGAVSAQGTIMEEHHLLVLKPGQEFELSVMGASTVLVVVVEEEFFRSYSLARWGEPFVLRDGRDRLVLARVPQRESGCRKWEQLILNVIDKRNLLSDWFSARPIEQKVLDRLLSNAMGTQDFRHRPLRQQAARSAERYLIANIHKPVSLADLCDAANVSERTLLLGFYEVFGTSPKRFLKSLLLNRVKQDLKRAQLGARVTDVALNWGFTHLSRFAEDYREMFGEFPHETLKNRPKTRIN